MSWEGIAADRTNWRSTLKQHLKTGKDKLMTDAANKRAKKDSSSIAAFTPTLYNGTTATLVIKPVQKACVNTFYF